MAFVVIGLSAFVDGVRVFFSVPECEKCKLYEELLEVANAKRDYYEQLLLTKAGIIRDETEIDSTVEFQSVHRINTMSSVRRMAAQASVERDKAKKEAKRKFEEAIEKSN